VLKFVDEVFGTEKHEVQRSSWASAIFAKFFATVLCSEMHGEGQRNKYR